MRVALLTDSGAYAAAAEECLNRLSFGEVSVVWTVDQPGSVLAALDHQPDLYLLDMCWRHRTLAAGRTLRRAGVERIVCIFDQPADPLIPPARAHGFVPFLRTVSWEALLKRIWQSR